MRKNLKSMIAGILVGALLTSGFVFAKDVSEITEIFYKNIKLFIEGAEIIPKDANGNPTEPFIMNGTTYLPVRAVSSAFGQDVEWDGTTQSIYIGKKDQTKPDNYLDRIQYNDYKEGDSDDDFSVINGTVTDYNGNIYTNGLIFYNDSSYSVVKDDMDKANILISYPLNSQYKTLKGKIVLPKKYNLTTWGERDNCDTSATDVWFYGDGKLLWKATAVTASMPFSFDIKTSGVNNLTIKIKTQDYYSYVALTDLALYK